MERGESILLCIHSFAWTFLILSHTVIVGTLEVDCFFCINGDSECIPYLSAGLSTTERERHSTRGDFYGTKGNHLYPYQLAIRQSNSEPLRINH
jgi:hypothetical protein